MLQAIIDRDLVRGQVKIYLLDNLSTGVVAATYVHLKQQAQWAPVFEGDPLPPALVLDNEVYEALAQAINDNKPSTSEATEDHLWDVIRVRDRLLALIERSHP